MSQATKTMSMINIAEYKAADSMRASMTPMVQVYSLDSSCNTYGAVQYGNGAPKCCGKCQHKIDHCPLSKITSESRIRNIINAIKEIVIYLDALKHCKKIKFDKK